MHIMTSLTFICKIGEVNHSLSVEEPTTTTVRMAKELLSMQSGEGGSARWIYKGRVLQDSQMIAECGIEPGTVVIVMRATPSAAAPAVASTLSAGVFRPNRTASMDTAVNILLNASDDVVHTAIETAMKICSNVINNPSEAKYRRLPAANAGLNSKLLAQPGGRELLLAVGFELTADGSAWCLEPSGDRWATLTACYDKLAAFSARLSAARAPLTPPVSAPTSVPTPAAASAIPAVDQQAALATLLASIAAASLGAPAPSVGSHPGSGSSSSGGDPGSGPGADGAGAGTGAGI